MKEKLLYVPLALPKLLCELLFMREFCCLAHSNQQRTENGTSVASKNVTKRKPTKPVAVVRKVAVYNEEAHQKNPTILTTDSWKTGFKPTASGFIF